MRGERNWAGNHRYRAGRFVEPRSLEELQELVFRAEAVRVLGSRHSFNDIADTTGDLVSTTGMPAEIAIDAASWTVTVSGAVRYGVLSRALDAAGFALPNLASLPHISVAGACATGTHGSGNRVGNLATAVSAIELVRADGEIQTITRSGDPETLNGAVVSLGALGVATRLTLDLEPRFEVRQDVYEHLPAATLVDRFDDVTASAYSVSCFTDWTSLSFHQVWRKQRVDRGAVEPPAADFLGARRASRDLHPVPGYPADACTPQRGVPGPWYERLPHFRIDHTPSAGDELQSEYLVDRQDIGGAIEALHGLRERIAPLVFVTEIRTVAADELWLSPSHRRASAAIHFTWKPDWPRVKSLLPSIERALQPFEPRAHWGKLFTLAPDVVASGYVRRAAFEALAARLDPTGKFRNRFVRRYVFRS